MKAPWLGLVLTLWGAGRAVAQVAPPTEPERKNWAFFPGIYRPSGGGQPVGCEVSILYRGVGVALGTEPELKFKTRYAEAELALWLVSVGYGVRNESGVDGRQFTWALPVLPLFPYGRSISLPSGHRSEYGLMLKWPFFDFAHLQGVM